MSTGRVVDTDAPDVPAVQDLRRPGHVDLCRCFDCFLWRASVLRHPPSSSCYNRGCRRPGCVEASRKKFRTIREACRERGLPDGDPRHGTRTAYETWGCRCRKCTTANSSKPSTAWAGDRREKGNAQRRQRRAERRKVGLPADDPRHGTRYAYIEWGCSCEKCLGWKRADNAARRERDKVRAVSQPGVVGD